MTGPVTLAIAAMRKEPDPPRRSVLAGIGAAITGAALGLARHQTRAADLKALAEEWLRDATDLGLWVTIDTKGQVWRGYRMGGTYAAADAQDAHWDRIAERPDLMAAVYDKVRAGFFPA